MTKIRLFQFVLLLSAAVALGLSPGSVVSVMAQDVSHATQPLVTVTDAWARPAIVGGNGAVYFELTNLGAAGVTLTEVTSDVARVTEIHETVLIDDSDHNLHGDHSEDLHHHDDHAHQHDHHMDHMDHHHDHMHMGHASGGTFIMRHIERLPIDAGEQIHFAPAGYHIMLIDLYETLAWGSSFEITLHFEDGSEIVVQVAVGDQPTH